MSVSAILSMLLMGSAGALTTDRAEPSGLQIARQAYERNDGDQVSQTLEMKLVDRNGNVRMRTTTLIRKEYEDVHKTIIFINEPSHLKGTGFLTFDYQNDAKDDDQWLYLPAMRRERRISASDRGAYFLGTDFTFEDIKERTRLSVQDLDFRLLGAVENPDGEVESYKIEATPKNDEIARSIGYGKIEATVNAETWMYEHLIYWDIGLNPLKEIKLGDLAVIDGIITARNIECRNLKTGHSTTFHFKDTDYVSEVSDRIFSVTALRRGLF